MTKLTQAEIVELFDMFLNEMGQWQSFKEWLEEKGYKIEELGMKDDE